MEEFKFSDQLFKDKNQFQNFIDNDKSFKDKQTDTNTKVLEGIDKFNSNLDKINSNLDKVNTNLETVNKSINSIQITSSTGTNVDMSNTENLLLLNAILLFSLLVMLAFKFALSPFLKEVK